ncbi:hypothetical protein ASF06_15580 [Agreia sp. Leaf244]|nr:hypothetical protein ASF06_15580 [Agreia sp. Leaf244]
MVSSSRRDSFATSAATQVRAASPARPIASQAWAGLVRDFGRDPGAGRVAGATDRLPGVGRFEQGVTGIGAWAGTGVQGCAVLVEELTEALGDVAEGCVVEVHTRSQTVATDIGSAGAFNA